MEELMNYTVLPPLKHGAFIKTAISLWNQDDARDLIAKVETTDDNPIVGQKNWLQVEGKVMEKVKELPLPESLKKELLYFIQPIGLELLKLREYHNIFFSGKSDVCFVKETLNKICWTQQGALDRKKTAEALIRDENLDIKERYILACNFCPKNDIWMLWNKMPECFRKSFYTKNPDNLEHTLAVFWTYELKGEMSRLEIFPEYGWSWLTPYQYAFEYSAESGHKEATEYFLQKLTFIEREESLIKIANDLVCYICSLFPDKRDKFGVLCFLLSQMNKAQQLEVLKDNLGGLLICLLDWPLQIFFIETAKMMWDFLSEDIYCCLLELIVDKVKDGYKDYNYQELFTEFWQQSPKTYKEYVMHMIPQRSLLVWLSQIKDMKNIKLILKNESIADREKVIFSDAGKAACESLLLSGEMDLFKSFVQECITSKDVMIRFKEELKEYLITYFDSMSRASWRSKCFQVLNDLIQKYDERLE